MKLNLLAYVILMFVTTFNTFSFNVGASQQHTHQDPAFFYLI